MAAKPSEKKTLLNPADIMSQEAPATMTSLVAVMSHSQLARYDTPHTVSAAERMAFSWQRWVRAAMVLPAVLIFWKGELWPAGVFHRSAILVSHQCCATPLFL